MESMRAWVRGLVLLGLAGCSPYDDLALLDLTAVEPPQIEPGGSIRLEGEGFPLGLTPSVVLEGTLYRPGVPAEAIRAELPAEVETEARIVVPVPPDVLDSFGGRGTFDGNLRLAFRSTADRRNVYADRNVVVDFLPDTTRMLRAGSDSEPSPSLDAADFGLVLSREESGGVGVRVESVEPGALADVQGVRAGDTVVGLDGLRIYSWRDFHPDPTRSESRVSVARKGLAGVHALRWPHEATVSRASVVALGFMMLVGLLIGWRSPMVLCLRRASRGSTATWLTRASVLLVLSAVLACADQLATVSAWILGLGFLAALQSFASRTRTVAVDYALAVASAVTIMILARSASLASIAAEQTTGVLAWYAFQSPASTLAFVAFVSTLGRAAHLERLSSTLYASAGAVFGTAVFLGGVGLGEPLHEAIPLLFAKALLLLVVCRWVALDRRAAATAAGVGLVLASFDFTTGVGAIALFWAPAAVGSAFALLARAALPPLHRPSAPAVA